MAMTVDQIVREVSHLSREEVAELVDRLTLNLHHAMDSRVDEAWDKEVQRRWAEIESGKETRASLLKPGRRK